MEAFQRWLANSIEDWLLIIDNADDPSMDVSQFFPPGNRGTVIVTTRNPDCKTQANVGSSEVRELPAEEAITLLLRASGEEETDLHSRHRARPVVDVLWYFALAIIHAGAVIRQKLYSFEEYCVAYRDGRKELLNFQPVQACTDYKYTVYTTWEISVNSIRNIANTAVPGNIAQEVITNATNALELLDFFGFCHFDGITETMFLNAWKDLAYNTQYTW